MKALTLWQPWASLVALGIKTIETRSWSTQYRGPLAIHAAKRKPDVDMGEDGPFGELWDDISEECLVQWGETPAQDFDPPRAPLDRWWLTLAPEHRTETMPLGRVVATCELVDVLPIVEEIPPLDQRSGLSCVTVDLILNVWPSIYNGHYVNQRPYADVRPGRFAWLLRNAQPLAEPVPAKGAQGLWEWEALV